MKKIEKKSRETVGDWCDNNSATGGWYYGCSKPDTESIRIRKFENPLFQIHKNATQFRPGLNWVSEFRIPELNRVGSRISGFVYFLKHVLFLLLFLLEYFFMYNLNTNSLEILN